MPEMASFTTGSNNLPGIVYENSPEFIEFLAGVFKETGVRPEIEVFETGMISNALYLQKKGLIEAPLHFDFVRVGLEDNLYLPDGSPASNPKLVDKVVAIAKEIGREIAGPDEARSLLSLNPQFKDRILT